MKSLEVLDLRKNPLQRFPRHLAALPRLQRLILAQTEIDSLPAAVGGFPALRYLVSVYKIR
jgi:Leucine-rich repeat (LRR) protein